MLWQQFTNKEGGEKKRRDRWMLLALFGILILVIVWPVGSKSKEADNQVSESVAGTEKRTYNYAEQYTANMELRLKEILENVDGRFFRLYMYTALAPLPLAAFAGESTQSVGISFLKSYVGVCLEGAVIVLACVIYSAFVSTPTVTSGEATTIVWSYLAETVFNMLVLVGLIKGSDRIIHEMMGL
jgi:hypothetical protein